MEEAGQQDCATSGASAERKAGTPHHDAMTARGWCLLLDTSRSSCHRWARSHRISVSSRRRRREPCGGGLLRIPPRPPGGVPALRLLGRDTSDRGYDIPAQVDLLGPVKQVGLEPVEIAPEIAEQHEGSTGI